jgi:hypothetical protein
MSLFKKANLTAQPAILSTTRCKSAIQHNTRGLGSRLSELALTRILNTRIGNTRSHPKCSCYRFPIVKLWQQFWQQRQWFQTIGDEHRRTAHSLSKRPEFLRGRYRAGQKSRYREFNSPPLWLTRCHVVNKAFTLVQVSHLLLIDYNRYHRKWWILSIVPLIVKCSNTNDELQKDVVLS